MSRPLLTRPEGAAGPPARLLHLGLGNFFRAHQCAYTGRAEDGEAWPIAAFTGTVPGTTELVRGLSEQDGLFTLIERGPDRDRRQVIRSLHHVHPAADHDAWLDYWRSPHISAVTLTVTEASYRSGPAQAEVAALRSDPTAAVSSAPARLLAGLSARRRADAGPIALVPCDNVPGNGQLLRRMLTELADSADLELPESVSVVTTMVDRITPRVTGDDRADLAQAVDYDDRWPVVTEPFSEWVLSGAFPAGRPAWQTAGATFTGDVTPYEERKLWLLNGAHSLLAYTGSIRHYGIVAEAVADERCLAWLHDWWELASAHLGQPAAELAAYRSALLTRFGNARMRDRLDRIAVDGSQKLPVRILPVLSAERAAGRMPTAATRVLAAWVCHLQGIGNAPVTDVNAGDLIATAQAPQAVRRLLDFLRPGLGDDRELDAVITEQCRQLRA